MRPRSEVALALGTLALLVAAAGLLGRRPAVDQDERPSTLLAGPGGARGILEGLRRLGIPVQRFRKRPRELARLTDSINPALVIVGPTIPFSAPERSAILAFGAGADLVLAGKGAEPLMRCFGYRVNRRLIDSVRVAPPGETPGARAPWVRATLVATGVKVVVDSTRSYDVARVSCAVPKTGTVDTLLLSERGRPVALRLQLAGRIHGIILIADEELFRNRTVRRSDMGPWLLGLLDHYDHVIFEEYHHGFGASGSLADAAIEWSVHSPWGWVVWQAAGVGVLALLFGAIRFGPARPGISRTRRSSLEHLRALATALAAARGHDVAIGAIVRGLRRRLLPPGLRTRGDWRGWLAQLGQGSLTARGRESLATLDALTRPGQPPSSVLRAANAVEDLWEDLRP